MDATSIITQVSPDDEQLNACPNDKGMWCLRYFFRSDIYIVQEIYFAISHTELYGSDRGKTANEKKKKMGK